MSKNEKVFGYAVAISAIAIVLLLSFLNPSLSSFQGWVLRLIASIGAALIASLFSGNVSVHGRHLGLAVRVTAGFVVFFAVFFLSPGEKSEKWFGLGPPPAGDIPKDISSLQLRLPGRDMLLRSHSGQLISIADDDFKFKAVLVSYTHSHCRKQLSIASALVEILAPHIPIAIYVISIDPERDTVREMQNFVVGHGYRFTMLTGSKSNIKRATDSLNIWYSHPIVNSPDYEFVTAMYLFEDNLPLYMTTAMVPPAITAQKILNRARTVLSTSPLRSEFRSVSLDLRPNSISRSGVDESLLAVKVASTAKRMFDTPC